MTRIYCNEIDPYAAQWMRNLMQAGLIPDGEVDERSIVDVRADDLDGFTQCHFFAGIAGWPLALRLAGWPDDEPVWTGSCPCQPFSVAGKRTGFDDDRHLWPVWRNLIAECRPPTLFGEQVASATDWLRLVRSDLEALDYAVGAIPVEAASAGADHKRDRYWIVADANNSGSQGRGLLSECAAQRATGADGLANSYLTCESEGWKQRSGQQCRAGGDQEACHSGDVGDTESIGRCRREDDENQWRRQLACTNSSARGDLEWVTGADGKSRRVKPGIRLLAHGVPNRVAKLRAFGNAIDPRPASQIISAFMECRP